jgi:dipeptidyl aminopeptidase/acylaminoacyl peptidase
MSVRLNAALATSSLVLALGGIANSAFAQTLDETAAQFGVRQSVLDISLSPSGDRIAFVSAGPRHTEVLNVIDLHGDMSVKPALNVTEQNADLSGCDWATDSRLVCRVDFVDESTGILIGFSRLIALDANGGNPLMLTPRMSARALGFRQHGGSIIALDVPGEDNHVLMTKEFVPERTIGTRLASDASGMGVEQVDVISGRRKPTESADEDAISYLADETGRVRMKVRQPADSRGNLGPRRYYHYRGADSDNWKLLSEVSAGSSSRQGYVPVAIDARRNVAYAFGEANGFDTVVEVPLAEGAQPKTLLAREDVDVDQLIRIGRQQRVVGASYATEKRAIEYFDAELAALAKRLGEALPGKPLVDIVGANADESKLLIIASSDTHPGTVYLYGKGTRELQELLPLRDHLADRTMGAMKPVSFPAADGTQIPGYLTLPPGSESKALPAIVLPHGGPSARDEWGFDWLVQFFVARGYAVLQPNYRGSTGYGSAWFGRNGFQAWQTAIGDVNDAGRWLVSQGIADASKLAVVGWSYGGYAALQSQVVDPSLYKAVVAIAPVTDLEQLRDDARPYTSYALVDRFIGRGQHVRAGSPTEHASRFAAPVLLFHGTLDQNVAVAHSRKMADKLKDAGKPVSYTEFEGLDHGLGDSLARTQMLTKIDGFLGQAMGE